MRKALVIALAASTIITAGAALAADQPPPPPGMGQGQADMDPQFAAERADDMALLLGLRPGQRPALDEFLGATMPPPRGGDDRRGPPDASMVQARMAAMQRFRASLTPDQQARLDALDRLHHGMGPRRRWNDAGVPQ